MSNEVIAVQDSSEATDSNPVERAWGDLTLVIEVPAGGTRKMGDASCGTESSMYMRADYGYVYGTVSMEEGDGLDIFVNPLSPDTSFGRVYVIALMCNDGTLNEEKVFLNFETTAQAKACFLRHYYSDCSMGYTYVMSDADFTAMCRAQIQAAKLKNANPALNLPEAGAGLEDPAPLPVDEVDICEKPEELRLSVGTTLAKSAGDRRVPIMVRAKA